MFETLVTCVSGLEEVLLTNQTKHKLMSFITAGAKAPSANFVRKRYLSISLDTRASCQQTFKQTKHKLAPMLARYSLDYLWTQNKQTNNMILKDHVISQHKEDLRFRGIFRFELSFRFSILAIYLELFLGNSTSL